MSVFLGHKKKSICIDCANSGALCSWSRDFVPVEGWEAEYVEGGMHGNNTRLPTYCVKSCPQFISDREAPKGTKVLTRSEMFYKAFILGGKDDDKKSV